MSDTFQNARQLEREGELSRAARRYTQFGIEELNDADFERGRSFRIGLSALVCGISCDVRAGNADRAVALRYLTDGLLEYALATDTDDRGLIGLYTEWLGDVHFMTGSGNAAEHYRNAIEEYELTSEGKQFSWGMEEEFDYAYWAVSEFLEFEGYERDQFPELDFESRARRKLEMSK